MKNNNQPLSEYAKPAYRKGGIVNKDMINIEKGELEVNPDTLEVVRKFDEAPVHPKGNNKNPKGNRYVTKGNAIIPADKAMAFMKGDAKMKQGIIDGLPKEIINGKAQGGLQPMPTYNPPMQYSALYPPSQYNSPLSGAAPQQSSGTGGGGIPGGSINPATAILGAYQLYSASEAIDELNKQKLPTLTDYQKYDPAELQKSYARAELMAERGFTGAEESVFKANLASSSAGQFRRATDIAGGSLSGSLQAAINAGDTAAINRFAAEDAALRRRNIQYADTIAGRLQAGRQAQTNLMTQGQREYERMLFNRRLLTEQALGAAKIAGQTNIANSLNIPLSVFGV